MARYWARQTVELCQDIDDETQTEFIEPILDAEAALEHDRRVIFIGAAKSGKSSLLAGLAQYSLPARVPMQNDYVCWRYRSKDGDATCSAFIPLENLEGLELVDTADCSDAKVADTVRVLLKGADAIIAVLDAREAEASPVWALLAELPEQRRNTCLIAVTHTDMLAAEAALQLKESLRVFCRKRLSATPALYFISPTTMKGMEGFTNRVQEALAEPHGVRAAIRLLLERVTALVRKQSRILNARSAVSRTDNGFLAGIEQEIDHFLSHQLAGIKSYTDAYSEAALQALPTTLSKLSRVFGWWLSPVTLVRMELFGPGAEKFYYRTLRTEILKLQEMSDGNFVLSCAGHWRHVRPRMKKTLECEIGDFPETALQSELAELRMRLGRDLYKPFTQCQLRRNFAQVFNSRIPWMCVCIALLCFLLVLAGVLGFIGQDAPAIWLLFAAAITWLCGSVAHFIASRRIRREVVQRAQCLQEEMLTTLSGYVEQLLISRVAAYRRLYIEPRKKVAQHDAMLKPLQERHQNITRQISAIAPRL